MKSAGMGEVGGDLAKQPLGSGPPPPGGPPSPGPAGPTPPGAPPGRQTPGDGPFPWDYSPDWPTGGGNFSPDVPIDTSRASVNPGLERPWNAPGKANVPPPTRPTQQPPQPQQFTAPQLSAAQLRDYHLEIHQAQANAFFSPPSETMTSGNFDSYHRELWEIQRRWGLRG